jgi:hypothetical protein
MNKQDISLSNGVAAAAFLASGIGSFILGLATVLKESVDSIGKFMNFYNPVGPLSGDTIITIAAWLVSWLVLHALWKAKEVDFTRIFVASLILIGLGLAGTFPPFFDLFH